MIELHITPTMKSYAPGAEWERYESERHTFADMAAARQWLRERYGKSKRSPMYVDRKDGDTFKTVKIGYVIGYRNADWSHAPVQKWLQQDWIEFRECNVMELRS